jgi:hypothetical protein
MKIILASYWEPENHGSGRKIGISPAKPRNLDYDCDVVLEALSPDDDCYYKYHEEKRKDYERAGKEFVQEYTDKLKTVVQQIIEQAEEDGVTPQDILGLQDEDTLLSWEKGGHLTYRTHTAEALRALGYETEER